MRPNRTFKQYQRLRKPLLRLFQLAAIRSNLLFALRDSNALSISLVAEIDKKVVGNIAFSPVTISDVSPGWYGLGPVSVLPELHKQGIGKSLMREGLSMLKSMGAKGCVLVGDPGYYERFGFRSIQDLVIDGVSAGECSCTAV